MSRRPASEPKPPRKHGIPPPRLSWAPSLSLGTTSSSSTSHKRRRHDYSHQTIWVDKYSPKGTADLCVAPKKIQEVQSWIQEALTRKSAQRLLILVGSTGIGKSTLVRVLAKEMDLAIRLWNESFVARNDMGKEGVDRRLLVEQSSAMDSFDEFLQQSGAGFSSLQFSNEDDHFQQSIILLEELPNLHGLDMERRFREIMSRHVARTQIPTIFVYSDVQEGKHNPDDLERKIDADVLHSNRVTTKQIHPATKSKMKKVLDQIAKKEKLHLSPSFCEEMHHQSNGDIRFAINTLQLQSSGQSKMAKVTPNNRDVKLTTFHALGKLLYGKRRVTDDGREVLAFDPEDILERSDMGVTNSLRFLEYHSVDFFSDITELANSYEFFSDAALLLDQPSESHRYESIFPLGCASSIAGRAVACANKHPTANKFRQFSSPKVFDVIRNRKQNQILVEQLARRLAARDMTFSGSLGSTHQFVTESLPLLRIFAPGDVNPSLENLYSVARASADQEMRKKARETGFEDGTLFEQKKILEMDDIEDFDSESEDEVMKKVIRNEPQQFTPEPRKESGPPFTTPLGLTDTTNGKIPSPLKAANGIEIVDLLDESEEEEESNQPVAAPDQEPKTSSSGTITMEV